MRIWTQSLKPEIKEKIKNKQYSYNELCQIRDAITAPTRSKHKKPLIILVTVAAIFLIGLLTYLLFFLKGNTIILWCWLVIIYVAFGAWYGYGKIRFDFNSALKKGYPEVYKDLKIGFFYEEYVQK